MESPRLRIIVDHSVVTEVPLQGPVTLGRDPDNSVVLADPAVSGRHGRIELQRGSWQYTDLGGLNGTLVAAGPHLHRQQSIPLDELTQLKLGTTVVEFDPGQALENTPSSIIQRVPVPPRQPAGAVPEAREPALPPAPAPPQAVVVPPARLVVVTAEQSTTHDLAHAPVVLGRDPGCDVAIESPSVSSRHAELTCVDGRWSLRDLGSTNGTSVGLADVGEDWRPLLHGSHVILGDVDLLFVLSHAQDQAGNGGALDTEDFLRWLRRRRKLSKHAARDVSAACERGEGSVEELLVTTGGLHPGLLSELRHNAARSIDAGADGRWSATRVALWLGILAAAGWALSQLLQALLA